MDPARRQFLQEQALKELEMSTESRSGMQSVPLDLTPLTTVTRRRQREMLMQNTLPVTYLSPYFYRDVPTFNAPPRPRHNVSNTAFQPQMPFTPDTNYGVPGYWSNSYMPNMESAPVTFTTTPWQRGHVDKGAASAFGPIPALYHMTNSPTHTNRSHVSHPNPDVSYITSYPLPSMPYGSIPVTQELRATHFQTPPVCAISGSNSSGSVATATVNPGRGERPETCQMTWWSPGETYQAVLPANTNARKRTYTRRAGTLSSRQLTNQRTFQESPKSPSPMRPPSRTLQDRVVEDVELQYLQEPMALQEPCRQVSTSIDASTQVDFTDLEERNTATCIMCQATTFCRQNCFRNSSSHIPGCLHGMELEDHSGSSFGDDFTQCAFSSSDRNERQNNNQRESMPAQGIFPDLEVAVEGVSANPEDWSISNILMPE